MDNSNLDKWVINYIIDESFKLIIMWFHKIIDEKLKPFQYNNVNNKFDNRIDSSIFER